MGSCTYGARCSNVHVEVIVNHAIDNTISMLYRLTRNMAPKYCTHLAVLYNEGVYMHVCTHPLYAKLHNGSPGITLCWCYTHNPHYSIMVMPSFYHTVNTCRKSCNL